MTEKKRLDTERPCEHCGVLFRPLARPPVQRFCSKRCGGIARMGAPAIRVCKRCKRYFLPKKGTLGRVCSVDCPGIASGQKPTERRDRQKRVCEHCGRTYRPLDGSRKRFCSRRCVGLAQRRPPTPPRLCETCRLAFVPGPNTQGRFCSRQCAGVALRRTEPRDTRRQRQEKVCEQCGTPYRPWSRAQRFCSLACRMRAPDRSLPARVQRGISVRSDEECWPWTRARWNHGRGFVTIDGRKEPAHRVVWELVNGAIPPGGKLWRACDEPACCNLRHYWPDWVDWEVANA